ncbi:hypothetical protein NPIL_140411 [Nephila pilipes]|uniref:Uncharacterized protein n=1 Tax=Nephila pilipes TaxID=299642 RepID=A0A8X6PH53_NEPPI|nr:hypothetical protein NPIL_140411 [Nephila pilipes]
MDKQFLRFYATKTVPEIWLVTFISICSRIIYEDPFKRVSDDNRKRRSHPEDIFLTKIVETLLPLHRFWLRKAAQYICYSYHLDSSRAATSTHSETLIEFPSISCHRQGLPPNASSFPTSIEGSSRRHQALIARYLRESNFSVCR